MMNATRNIKVGKHEVKVVVSRSIIGKEVNLDGHVFVGQGKTFENIQLTINGKNYDMPAPIDTNSPFNSDKEMLAKGAYASANLQNFYLTRSSYDQIKNTVDELLESVTTDEWSSLKQYEDEKQRIIDENLERMAAEYAERQRHPGWCEKCGSYCYGDCANQ